MTDHALVERATRPRFGLWLLLYICAVAYVSLVVSPTGFTFKPQELADAWKQFASMQYYKHGADQRSDQMGNLLMFVPMGFLAAGVLSRRRDGGLGFGGAMVALGGCTLLVLVIKFAQIFFPRTVSLNYVLLQVAGSAIGIALFWMARRLGFGRMLHAIADVRALRLILMAYTAALFAFYLFPLNFALDQRELRDRLNEVPALLLAIPGAGRSLSQQLAVLLAAPVVTIPLGVLLALDRLRSFWQSMLIGVALLLVVQILAIPVINGNPSFVNLALRLVGVMLGFGLLRWLERRSPTWLRRKARGMVPWLVLPYLAGLVLANNLLVERWISLDQLLAEFDTRMLIPLWTHYIVSKAQAAVSVIVHVAMYAPIGLMLGLRRPPDSATGWLAAALAFVLALGIEIVRFFKQLGGDLNNPFIAAAAAGATVLLVPKLWRAIDGVVARPIILQREPPRRGQRGPLW